MRLMFDGIIYSLQARGGITTYTNNLLRSFIEVDPKLEISILVHHPLLQEIILPPNIHRIFVKEKSLIRKWKAKIAQKNSQIFHSSYYTHSDTSQGPQVVTVYDLIYELMPEYFPRTTETNEFLTQKKTSITKADAIICISETSKADLKRIYDLDDKKIHVIPLGVDGKVFNPGVRRAGTKITYVGSRAQYKNFAKLISAFSKWRKSKEYKLTIVGQPLTSQEKSLLDDFAVLDYELIDNPNEKELVGIYRDSHAVVLPSFYEGFGLPLLEAASTGTLVIASDIAAHREIGNDAPIYFLPKSADSLVHALESSLDIRVRSKHIDLGLAQAKKYSWRKTATETLKIYESLT